MGSRSVSYISHRLLDSSLKVNVWLIERSSWTPSMVIRIDCGALNVPGIRSKERPELMLHKPSSVLIKCCCRIWPVHIIGPLTTPNPSKSPHPKIQQTSVLLILFFILPILLIPNTFKILSVPEINSNPDHLTLNITLTKIIWLILSILRLIWILVQLERILQFHVFGLEILDFLAVLPKGGI